MMRIRAAFLVAALLPLCSSAEETTVEPSYCCNALSQAGLADRLLYTSSEAYHSRINSHFSVIARLNPECILQPHTAQEVSLAVTTLTEANKTTPCQFAIRSGGHTNFAGAANIANGVTIDLGLMNSTTYQAENKTAAVLPGATWGMVYSTLDKLGVMVAGGRASAVGVGGLVLGGGNSFYSPRMGLVCDNVVQFEVVLANGEIVYANKDQNADLFQVLKGGSNNFGIVTKIELAAFENPKLWGGVVVWPNTTAEKQFQALVKFTEDMKEDPHGAVIVFSSYLATLGINIFTNTLEYTKPEPKPKIFEEFMDIPGNITDTMRITNMTDLVEELGQANDQRVKFYTLTFKNNIDVLLKAHDLYIELVEHMKVHGTGDYAIHVLYQPIPSFFHAQTASKGGNVLGLDRSNDDVILYMIYLGWVGSEQDTLFQGRGAWIIEQISEYAKNLDALNEYIYLDYADEIQDPLRSYGKENVEKMRKAAEKFDPEGVFQYMVPGGFKLWKVKLESGGDGVKGHDEL